jgi:hypothetical protein
MDTFKALEVRRVTASEDLMKPGYCFFVARRAPKITVERTPLTPPQGFIKRLSPKHLHLFRRSIIMGYGGSGVRDHRGAGGETFGSA